MKKIITIDNDKFEVLGTIPADRDYSPDELKGMWTLADTVLKNGDMYYVCMKLIEAEFEDI